MLEARTEKLPLEQHHPEPTAQEGRVPVPAAPQAVFNALTSPQEVQSAPVPAAPVPVPNALQTAALLTQQHLWKSRGLKRIQEMRRKVAPRFTEGEKTLLVLVLKTRRSKL